MTSRPILEKCAVTIVHPPAPLYEKKHRTCQPQGSRQLSISIIIHYINVRSSDSAAVSVKRTSMADSFYLHALIPSVRLRPPTVLSFVVGCLI